MGQKNKFEHWYRDCELLYVHGKTFAEITARTDVSDKTLSKWKAEYNWEEKRKKFFTTSAGSALTLEQQVYDFIEEMRAEGMKHGDADELSKLMKALEQLRKVGDIYSMTVAVMDKFIDYINTEYSGIDDDTRGKRETLEAAVKGFFSFIEKRKAL